MLKHKDKFTLNGTCHVLRMTLSYRRTHPVQHTEAPFGGKCGRQPFRSFLVRNVENGLLWLLSLCVAGLLLSVQLQMRPWHTVLLRCFCLKAVYILWLCALFGKYGLLLHVIIREGIIQQFSWVGTRTAVKIPSVYYTRIELSTVIVTHSTGHCA